MAEFAPWRSEDEQPADLQSDAQVGRITQLLRAFSDGNRDAFDQLVPLVYLQLSRMAHQRLRRERRGHTLDTGALVHEAWMRLQGQTRTTWRSREHFLAVASEAMRRVLVDYAKGRAAQRRGGGQVVLSIDDADSIADPSAIDDEQAEALLALDDALSRLATFNALGARVVQYRYFGGLNNPEIALLLDTSERTVRRMWVMAKAWLQRELSAVAPDII